MPIETEVTDRRWRARASGDLTIYAAAELKRQLAEIIAAADEVELDLAGVRDFDSAGLQLLLWLRREGGQLRKRVRFTAPSPAVTDLLALYGLAQELDAAPGDHP